MCICHVSEYTENLQHEQVLGLGRDCEPMHTLHEHNSTTLLTIRTGQAKHTFARVALLLAPLPNHPDTSMTLLPHSPSCGIHSDSYGAYGLLDWNSA